VSPGEEQRSGEPAAGTRARGLWALWFVAFSLVALVVVPAYFGGRANEVQERIGLLEEAGSLGSRLSLLKAGQMARFESFLFTGDRSLRDLYVVAIVEEDSVFERLAVLARDLDFAVQERLADLHVRTVAWHFENQQVFRRDSIGDALAVGRSSYNDLQRSTRELDRAIQSEVGEGRRAVARVRAMQSRLTFALAALALGATLVVGRVGTRFRDLSEEAERRRRDAVRARREIGALVEATGDGVLGIDLEGKCISLNRAGAELLGYTERAIKGRDVHDTLLHTRADGTSWPRDESPILGALASGTAADSGDGAILWRRRARSFPSRWSLRAMVDGTELRGAVLTFTDMTEIREKEKALRRAIGQREDVVSIVSHDLRNPLGVVLAAADLLLDLPLDEVERRRQAQVIRRSGECMQSLIEDLLDVARIEAGAFVLHVSTEELLPILEEVHTLFEDQARTKRIRLEVADCATEPKARIDRDRIIQALANLLDNALRLTPEEGRVVLAVEERDGCVELSVSDDGPGIEPELLERLFDRFAQSSSSGGGAGLGLAIVKGVAVAHGGEVTADSIRSEGATFTIRLPRVASTPAGRVGQSVG
jgi:PAS domain S-box-containing protein